MLCIRSTRCHPITKPSFISIRLSSTSSSSTSTTSPNLETSLKSKAKSDWKRRQLGSNFIDTLSISVVSGRGGSGGVAFHREKFKERGPPSGGPGGTGGSVYLVATPTVTSLSHLPKTVRAGAGASGGGKWLAGKRGEDVVVRVPVGTVVREVKIEPNSEEEREAEEEERRELEWAWQVNKVRLHEAEKREVRWSRWKKKRDLQVKFGIKGDDEEVEPWQEKEEEELPREWEEALSSFRRVLFTMYPQAELTGHPSFLTTEHHLLSKMLSKEVDLPGKKQRRPRRRRRRNSSTNELEEEPLLYLDLTKPSSTKEDPTLLVSGGQAGLGNPSFLTHQDRSPKYATKGGEGEMMRLELEVKSTGEVGLVGLPNAGKSTLLRALTSSTPRVASFAFTTLNPHLGTCVLYTDGTFSGPRSTSSPSPSSPSPSISDTPSTPTHFSGSTLPSSLWKSPSSKKSEDLRFTITDNPGLLPSSHLNHGLGHSFLRHIERCSTLIYVVDLTSPAPLDPVESLKVLGNSLREYEKMRNLDEGELVSRIKGVVVNKADLFAPNENESEEEGEGVEEGLNPEEGRKRLSDVREYVDQLNQERRGEEDQVWMIPISAKKRENVEVLVRRLAENVKGERERKRIEEEERLREEEEGGGFGDGGERWIQ